MPLRERLLKDDGDFAADSVELRLQIGGKDARRIRIIGRRRLTRLRVLVSLRVLAVLLRRAPFLGRYGFRRDQEGHYHDSGRSH